jgi:hypothetical protein
MRSARIHSEATFRVATESSTVTDQIQAALNASREQIAELRAQVVEVGLVASTQAETMAARLQDELAALRTGIAETHARLTVDHERTLLALRMVRDDDAASRAALWALRATPGYAAAFDEDEPLVSLLISTYRNWPLLRDRAIPSVLAQSYERWELIVVGDAAPDETRRAVEAFGDPRVRFINLPYRGPYPADPRDAWQISGTTPWNTALASARGRWIATNGDDDALRPDHLESLLARARSDRAEVPYGRIELRSPDGPPDVVGAFPPFSGAWNLQASLLHAGLRFLPMQPSDWVFDVPNDVSLLERMLRIGVRFSMVEQTVVDCYPSPAWTDREQGRLARREQF